MKIFEHKITNKDDIDKISLFLFNYFKDKKFLVIFKELGLNIIKHTNGGYFKFYEEETFFKFVFDDKNSKRLDIKKAFIKGYSTSKTLGIGLNVVLNLSDEIEIIPKSDGTKIVVIIYKTKKTEKCLFYKKNRFEVALKVSPFTTISENGDCGLFSELKEKIIFALWDIEGHGSKEVYNSSITLKKYINCFKHFELEEMLETINYLIYSSNETIKRASMVIGEIKENLVIYQFGNVNFIVDDFKSSSQSGVLGMRSLFKKRYEFNSFKNIAIFSDGISKEALKIDFSKDAYILADEILKKYKKYDDSSIMIIKA